MADDGDELEAKEARTSPVGAMSASPNLTSFRRGKPSTNASPSRLSRQQSSAPSGIAQLRKSVDQSNATQPDLMNLDDYIFPSSVGSPAGISTDSPEDNTSASVNAVAAAIPIKTRKNSHMQQPANYPPASAPIPPQYAHWDKEFDYVQRHVRKTSIDESRVGV